MSWAAQQGFPLRFDWGPAGADRIVHEVGTAVVVDVLSFTTTLSVALDAGIAVLPYRFRDDTAADFARTHDAALAVGRTVAGPGEISLSPVSVRAAGPTWSGRRLVLPSPNGATLSRRLTEAGVTVVGASLRTATAVARWVAARGDGPVAVLASGEQWPDGSLRPAVEDLWGAGAVLSVLEDHGVGPASPEASSAIAAFRTQVVGADVAALLHATASGRELAGDGFGGDVDIAAELDTSSLVPVLVDDTFRPA